MRFNHLIHQRVQLTDDLRDLCVPVSPLYGSSAGENPFQRALPGDAFQQNRLKQLTK
jgi:hypothetical protein